MGDADSRKLKEEVELARKLAFQDFYDGLGDGTKRAETTKVLDTISKLEMEVQKQADDLRLKEEELEFNYQMKEEQLKIDKERLEMDKKRLEFEEAKRKEESEKAQRDKVLSYLDASLKTAEFGGSMYLAKRSFDHLHDVVMAEDQPRLIPRIPFDVAKRQVETFGKGIRHLRFK